MTVYLDNAATTAPLPEVIDAVAKAMRDLPGNPSSLHELGANAARALEQAREDVATLLHTSPKQLLFFGSGTEANATGLLGPTRKAKQRHLLTTSIEHACLYENARTLEKQGWEVTFVDPTRAGIVDVEAFVAGLRPETSVVALALVNNEIGSLLPVADIARAAHRHNPRIHVHVDAVQAAGMVPVDPLRLDADSVAISAHKLHGPKGVAALWVKNLARLSPLYAGGGQEQGLRSGTENVPASVGFGVAARAAATAGDSANRTRELRDWLETRILENVREAKPTIPREAPRAPHIASLLLPGFPAEPILHALEAQGVFASEGAACSTRKREQSRVLKALGIPGSTGAIRFSLSRFTTREEIEQAARSFELAVAEIRNVVKASR